MKINIENIDGLESHNMFEGVVRIFSVPFLNSLPASLIQNVMKKTSRDAGKVTESGGSTHALEVMYTRYHRKFFSRGVFQGIADYFWHHIIDQSSALRNRLKIVHKILFNSIDEIIAERNLVGDLSPVAILSIAGGSSRALLSSLVEIRAGGSDFPVEIYTIDKDKLALDVGARLASEQRLSKNFHWIHGNARDVKHLVPDKKFDLVEIVGLLDYFNDERASRLLGVAYSVMKDSAYIVVANVRPNPEIPFVHKTGWPAMIYRQPEDMVNLLTNAGFKEVDTILEPVGVHIIALAKK